MKSSKASDPGVAAQDVRAALAGIVVSPAFRASPQLASFLRFVVEAALAGQSDRIKGYTIAVEALGRDEKFDPQTDPIVRVEAGRLRRALDRYYEGPGKNDPIIIELPRGSYVPTVRRRAVIPHAAQPMRKVRALFAAVDLRSANVIIPAVVVLGIVAHAAINWLSPNGRPLAAQSTIAASTPAPARRMPPKLNPGPAILIERITATGELAPPTVLAASIETRLRDAFARYDDITVIARGSPSEDRASSEPSTGAPTSSIDYRLTGSIDYQTDATVTFKIQLVDSADGSIVWARSIERVRVAPDPGQTEATMVRDVASALLQQYGVINSRERKKHFADPTHDPHYGCLLDAGDYVRTYDHGRFWPLRRCLEKAIAEDPTFASGYAALAQLYRREFLFSLGAKGDTPPLDRALEAARRAVEIQPSHVRAHYTLLDVHMARGEIAEAMAAGERAIALNPLDTTARFRYGRQLILLGDVDRGLKLVNEAASYLAAVPPRFHASMAIAAYLKGDAAEASAHANQITTDRAQLGLIARILAAQMSGDRARATYAISRLTALQSSWQTDTREELKKYFHVPWIFERVLKDLTDAGLGGSPRPALRESSGTTLPMIYVEPFSQLGSRPPGSYDPAWVRMQLAQAMARFDEVTIATDQNAPNPSDGLPSSDGAAGAAAGIADYRLGSTVTYDEDGRMTLAVRLIENAGSTVLWTKTYDNLRPGESRGGALPVIAELSAALLHPFGVITMQERVRPIERPGAERYRCLLQSHDYLRSFAHAQHAKVRACLEDAIAADPQFAPAHVALARVFLREHQFGIGGDKDEGPALDRAQYMAERAIEISPNSARAHFAMFDILGARGDGVGVRRFGDKAMALNPNDPPVVFHYGGQLIMLGDIDRGVDMIKGLMATSTMPPARLDFALFVASYLKNDLQAAAHYAHRIPNEYFTPGLVARILATYRTDGAPAARRAIERLVAIEPRWRADPRGELRKFISSPALVDHFARDLALAGLTPVDQTASGGRSTARVQ